MIRFTPAVCAFALGAVTLTLAAEPPAPSEKVRKFIGDKTAEYLQRATKVEAFRVGPVDATKVGKEDTAGGRVIKGEAIEVDPATAARLIAALCSDDTYFREDSKGTMIGIGYRIWTDTKECVEVSCCVAKGNVWIVVKDAEGKVIAQGDRRGFRDDSASPMRVIAADVFPNDKDVNLRRPRAVAALKLAVDPAASPFEPNAKVEKLADGFKFAEGPASDAQGNIYFTDQPSDRILKWSTDGKLSTFLEKSGRSNGLCFGPDGKLWACADEKNELWKIDTATKEHVTAAKDHGGKLLNGPNDVWVRPDGGAYFTDPFYKRSYWTRGPQEQEKNGVYYVTPKGEVRLVDGDFDQPNGIIGTSDGKKMYVSDVRRRKIYAYEIATDGSLVKCQHFCDGVSDGMTLDSEGNLYLSSDKVYVHDKSGAKVAELAVPERPSNLCFGGKDGKTLFITARQGLYSIRARVTGAGSQ
ncbi:SMP-30/gluconolactonase/LRE family protein [Gemmata sp.]|uniref:SMP-30/gluconolactonase/LRE family protein n=1 Tax=Gemmata sp. TaxID=1914242 RepID=UPI003F6F41D3